MPKEITKEEARHELNQLLSNAFDTIVLKRPEAVQTVVIAEHPARNKRPQGTPPKSYLIACYMERTREEDALDAILGPDKDNKKPKGCWEFDYQDGPVTTIQLKTTTKTEYNIKGTLTITYRGYEFKFNNGGTGDSYKAAVSDAFKRCCGDAGFTRKFWQQQRTWVQYTPDVEKLFRYGNPTLKELGGGINKERIFLDKSPHLKTLSLEEFLALEDTKELPETISIKNKGSEVEMPLEIYFTKSELENFMKNETPEEEIKMKLEHRSHFTYSYSPKSPLVFSQLSKMKKALNKEQWETWKEKAKEKKFNKIKDHNGQINEIALFKLEIDDVKEVLEKK